jgi:hypothetical protein
LPQGSQQEQGAIECSNTLEDRWIKVFYGDARSFIPNRRYAYGAVYLVYGIWESSRKLGINYRDAELSD